MPISFVDFLYLGRDQWRGQTNPLGALFVRLFGPLGTHARIRNARVINTLEGIDLSSCRVIDFGCGYGYTLFYLARRFPTARLMGIEANPAQVEVGNASARLAGLKGLAFSTQPFEQFPAEPQYDLAISIDVLEHVQDDAGMLRKLAAVLRPGGWAVIHVPLRHQLQQRIFPVFAAHTVADHVRDEYLPEEIRAGVEQAGLQVVHQGFGFGPWGELSFELNNLFWDQRWLRNLATLVTLPLALVFGFIDSQEQLAQGNSIVLLARKPGGPLPGAAA